LLTHRRRAEQALVSVVATAYLLGVSTRRVERLAEQLGVIPEVSMDGVRPRMMKMGGCLATTPAAAWCPVGPF
jgi:transposase-like protein